MIANFHLSNVPPLQHTRGNLGSQHMLNSNGTMLLWRWSKLQNYLTPFKAYLMHSESTEEVGNWNFQILCCNFIFMMNNTIVSVKFEWYVFRETFFCEDIWNESSTISTNFMWWVDGSRTSSYKAHYISHAVKLPFHFCRHSFMNTHAFRKCRSL